MAGPLLRNQADISASVPMPTDRVDDTSVSTDVAAETLVWYYVTGGAFSAAVGQAAGTITAGKLTYNGVLNSFKTAVGNINDSSVVPAAATRIAQRASIPEDILASLTFMTPAQQVVEVAKYLTVAGDYCTDHRRGVIWANMKAIVANDTIAYSYSSTLSGGGTGDKVDVIKIGGVAVPVDDAAFTPGTTPVIPVGFFADETATDSVNEGDTGAARMTLDRKQINASEYKEDVAHTEADYLSVAGTKRTDTAASSAGTDGDYATLNTDATGRLWVNTEMPDAAALADATANPTTTSVGDFISGFNGATWDRIRTGLTAVVTSVVGYLNTLPFVKYNATAPTLTDGQSVVVQADVNGNMQVNQRTLGAGEDLSNNVIATSGRKLASPTYSPLLFTNFGANATLNVKASAGNLFAASCSNSNAAARYLQFHNTATVPAGSAVPLLPGHLIPAGAEVVLGEDFFSAAGLNFTTGIAFAVSTTQGTYTAATAGDHFTEVHYI